MFILRAASCAALFLWLLCVSAMAEDVTLTSHDGDVTLSGTLLGFDGEFYRLKTVYGELTIDGSGVSCTGPGCPSLTDFVAELNIAGAATIGDILLPALIEAFALRNGYATRRTELDKDQFEYVLIDNQTGGDIARFTFSNSNSDEGFADLLANDADIAMSLREVRDEEVALAREAGLGNLKARGRSRILALDALVAITAAGNPVQKISPSQLARVFAGEIDNWQALGGPDAPIAVHLRDASSGLGQAVVHRVLGPMNLTLANAAQRHESDGLLVRSVASDPFAIGIGSFSSRENAQVLTLTGTCGFSLSSSRRTIKTEDYPLTSPMFLYLPARRLPKLAREFLAYLRSPAAQVVVRRAGFVDQSIEEISIDRQGDRFANAISVAGPEVSLKELQRMIATLSGMRRLSTTFRFEAGSIVLDAQSRSNVQQLARALEAGMYETRKLLFVGFSDGEGPAKGNTAIARRRAKAVMDAVMAAAETADRSRLALHVDAFGEALPIACDDSSWGRQANRRVEVWVK